MVVSIWQGVCIVDLLTVLSAMFKDGEPLVNDEAMLFDDVVAMPHSMLNVKRGVAIHLMHIFEDQQLNRDDKEMVEQLISGLKEFWTLAALVVSLLLTVTIPYNTEALATKDDTFPGVESCELLFHVCMVLSSMGSLLTILISVTLYMNVMLVCPTMVDKIWFLTQSSVNSPQHTMIYLSVIPFSLALPLGVFVAHGPTLGIVAASIFGTALLWFLVWFSWLNTKVRAQLTASATMVVQRVKASRSTRTSSSLPPPSAQVAAAQVAAAPAPAEPSHHLMV